MFAVTRTPDASFARSQVPDDWRGIVNSCQQRNRSYGFRRAQWILAKALATRISPKALSWRLSAAGIPGSERSGEMAHGSAVTRVPGWQRPFQACHRGQYPRRKCIHMGLPINGLAAHHPYLSHSSRKHSASISRSSGSLPSCLASQSRNSLGTRPLTQTRWGRHEAFAARG